ncbi:hypothetical protein RIR_jg5274.t1 [Rhizophagus irregularis DAOM 181602=DAOM 197198]|nr:hypothetical protein RIR_jg5274.t1 [Rhizophagus irregularis DAOM 181602=DAOM 197198]
MAWEDLEKQLDTNLMDIRGTGGSLIQEKKPYKKRKFGICPEKYGKCPEIFRVSGKHSETVMFWNIFRTLDSGQIPDKFWSVKKMSGICASGKCSKT